MTNITDHELQAFFRACEKNGISVSTTPNEQHERSPVVIGENGERFIITPDMKVQFQLEQNEDNLPKKKNSPQFDIGDTLRVHVRIKEGNHIRIQVFEGRCIAKQQRGATETFTVRRIAYNVGSEKTFSLHSPVIEKVELVRQRGHRNRNSYWNPSTALIKRQLLKSKSVKKGIQRKKNAL